MPATVPPLTAFPSVARDVLRFRDTDGLGHVNNAVFATFCETGRTVLLYDPAAPLVADGCDFVIARLELDFVAELHWPGEVLIGTGVRSVGRSSLRLLQGVFAAGKAVARAESVLVQIDRLTRKASPLAQDTAERLAALSVADPGEDEEAAPSAR